MRQFLSNITVTLISILSFYGCTSIDGCPVKEASMQGITATVREDLPIGSKLEAKILLKNAPKNLKDVKIRLSGDGATNFDVNLLKDTKTNLYKGSVVLAKSLMGEGGKRLNLRASTTIKGKTIWAPIVVKILDVEHKNITPIAKIDGNRKKVELHIYEGEQRSISADYSLDEDDGIVYCAWKNSDNKTINEKSYSPPINEIGASQGCKIELSHLKEGRYKFQLLVQDKSGSKDSNIANIYVTKNHKPTVQIDGAPDTIEPNKTLTLTAIGNDEDSDNISYKWLYYKSGSSQKHDGGNKKTFSHKFAQAGSYHISVRATDTHNASSQDSVTIKVVSDNNKPPVAVIGMDYIDRSKKQEEQNITSAVGVKINEVSYYSFDPDGEIISCYWENQIGEKIRQGEGASCDLFDLQYDEPSMYKLTLYVTDNDGATSSNVLNINVLPNDIPQVEIKTQSPEVPVNSSVRFDGDIIDNDDETVDYWWSIKNLATNKTQSTNIQTYSNSSVHYNITFDIVGDYEVSLIAKDEKGAKNSASVIVHVFELE